MWLQGKQIAWHDYKNVPAYFQATKVIGNVADYELAKSVTELLDIAHLYCWNKIVSIYLNIWFDWMHDIQCIFSKIYFQNIQKKNRLLSFTLEFDINMQQHRDSMKGQKWFQFST